jgi:NitT/TauT family transport system ATP-binding protein
MALVRALGKTSILITHRIDEALEVGDRVVVFHRPGRIVHQVSPGASDRGNPDQMAKLRSEIEAVMAD